MLALQHLHLLPPNGELSQEQVKAAIEALRSPQLRTFLAVEVYRSAHIRGALKFDLANPQMKIVDDVYQSGMQDAFMYLLNCGEVNQIPSPQGLAAALPSRPEKPS